MMRKVGRLGLCLSTAVTLLLSACGAAQRPALSDWAGCLIEQAQIDTSELLWTVGAGSDHVVYFRTQWGSVAGRTEYSGGGLLVGLPAELEVSQTFTIGDQGESQAEYREGTLDVVYLSQNLDGTVTVGSIEGDRVSFSVDLQMTNPVVDLDNRGDDALSGEAEAIVVESLSACFAHD